jgi:phosphopantothenate---cysteine ligase (CTP)
MNIIITAGGTTEKIDGIKKITNISTGKLGSMILEKIVEKFKNEKELCIYYLSPRSSIKPKYIDESKIIYLDTDSIEQVNFALTKLFQHSHIDWFIHSMAHSDFQIKNIISKKDINNYIHTHIKNGMTSQEIIKVIDASHDKVHNFFNDRIISTENDELIINLTKTQNFLEKVRNDYKDTKIISFKILNGSIRETLIKEGIDLLKKTKSEYVIASDLKDIKTGLTVSLLINKNGDAIEMIDKNDISENIVEILNDYYIENKISSI